MSKASAEKAAAELRAMARELTDLAEHPETQTSPDHARALGYAARRCGERAQELDPFRPRKFS